MHEIALKLDKWIENLTKDGDEADTLGEVNIGPEGKGSDDEDSDAGDPASYQDGLNGVGDGDDPDDDAVQGGHHTQQDHIQGIPPSHLHM